MSFNSCVSAFRDASANRIPAMAHVNGSFILNCCGRRVWTKTPLHQTRSMLPLYVRPVYLGGSANTIVWTARLLLFGDKPTSVNSWGEVARYSKSKVSPTAI